MNIHFKKIGLLLLTYATLIGSINAQIQIGQDIVKKLLYDYTRASVSMPDVNTVAVGAYGNGAKSGQRIYFLVRSTWSQNGADIDGEAGDYSGPLVSMPGANIVAIGANRNSGRNNL